MSNKTYELPNNVTLSEDDLRNIIYVLYDYMGNNDNKISEELKSKEVGFKMECILDEEDYL